MTTPRKRCTAHRCMRMADHIRPALCEDHWRERRIDHLTAQRDRLAGLLRRLANTQDSTEEDYRAADAALAELDKP